ncbi:MAG: glutathione S-transferase family protein [Alphaproteobacteria bacterium]|nr:glutathione S-transferase family protein [Alphaproteobacteria bacterium]
MRLYYSPNSCALASHILLEEVDANYSIVEINFKENEQRQADYLSINAKGRVPALLTEDGILTETPAILLYIAQRYPEKKMVPKDNIFQLAKVQEFNSYLCSTVHVAHAHLSRGSRWADDPLALASMTAKVPETIGACFAFLESSIGDMPWVLGNDYSICDPYLFTVTRWLKRDGVARSNFPKIDAHYGRMKDRLAVRNIVHLHEK